MQLDSTLGPMATEFSTAIDRHQAAFGLSLSSEVVADLERYYEILLEHNPILHLIGPMDAEEFAVRHILESLMMLQYLPPNARFADVGSGGGLPAIPCLLARDDLMAVLIESKEKKSKFLDIVINELALSARARVVPRQFTEVDPANCSVVTCRALDKFQQKLPRLLKWASRRDLLLYSGPDLREVLRQEKADFDEILMPLSERRFLFHVRGKAK